MQPPNFHHTHLYRENLPPLSHPCCPGIRSLKETGARTEAGGASFLPPRSGTCDRRHLRGRRGTQGRLPLPRRGEGRGDPGPGGLWRPRRAGQVSEPGRVFGVGGQGELYPADPRRPGSPCHWPVLASVPQDSMGWGPPVLLGESGGSHLARGQEGTPPKGHGPLSPVWCSGVSPVPGDPAAPRPPNSRPHLRTADRL